MRITSVDSLLDPPVIAVVTAVPQFVPKLILALHQALPGSKGNRLHGLRQPGAEADLLGCEARQGEADIREAGLASRLVRLQSRPDLVQRVGGAAQ